jgi:hypothetical protein
VFEPSSIQGRDVGRLVWSHVDEARERPSGQVRRGPCLARAVLTKSSSRTLNHRGEKIQTCCVALSLREASVNLTGVNIPRTTMPRVDNVIHLYLILI